MATNERFEIRGVNHIALVSSDMARTVRFYRDILGMPLVKTIDMPGGAQHFFFDMGNDDCLAFFWFPGAAPAEPGVSNAPDLPDRADITTAHGSMNHLAFDVPLEHFEEYRQRLIDAGVDVSMVLDHDDSEWQVAREFHPGVFVRSFYFRDPDGILLEFAAWTREMGRPDDVSVDPVDASGTHVPT
ncbi:MAG: VOC family protein [Actinomycetota bacterium]|jgi:catechol 2,3-dioxygenase-like lactoylglutathione lyase family enzyme|nr:VOC family protein [Actinomycetota bacterium]MDA3014915.1 VOC family protein [Actinomycetota bacterium]MDA3028667.1 VOC family protein [Actinomycetota bacterium]